jgi:hypothetical protein
VAKRGDRRTTQKSSANRGSFCVELRFVSDYPSRIRGANRRKKVEIEIAFRPARQEVVEVASPRLKILFRLFCERKKMSQKTRRTILCVLNRDELLVTAE